RAHAGLAAGRVARRNGLRALRENDRAAFAPTLRVHFGSAPWIAFQSKRFAKPKASSSGKAVKERLNSAFGPSWTSTEPAFSGTLNVRATRNPSTVALFMCIS